VGLSKELVSTNKTAILDWFFRVCKYGCLIGATFCVQHTLFLIAILFVIAASTFDYWAQIMIIRREI